jgi:hypothetical protein
MSSTFSPPALWFPIQLHLHESTPPILYPSTSPRIPRRTLEVTAVNSQTSGSMSTVHEYVLWLCWGLLTLCHKGLKNPVHDMLFPTVEVMEKHLSSISFAAGLLAVLQSDLPPTIDFFKSLPADVIGLWGIYLILLEKADHRPKIYIGSSVNVAGMNTRFTSYNNGHSIPQWVQHAIDNGFTITYKGVLWWTTIPPASTRFPVRSLMLLLESTFALALWAMLSRTKTYAMPSLLSWTLDGVHYDGCCSHVAISEKVWGEDEGLTADQIAAKEAEMEIRRKEHIIAGGQRHCAKVKAGEFEGWYERKRATTKKSHAKVKKSRKWSCKPCGKAFISQYALNDHKSRSLHLNKVKGYNYSRPDKKRRDDEIKAAKTFHCSLCNSSCTSESKLRRHNEGPRHIKKAAAAAQAAETGA